MTPPPMLLPPMLLPPRQSTPPPAVPTARPSRLKMTGKLLKNIGAIVAVGVTVGLVLYSIYAAFGERKIEVTVPGVFGERKIEVTVPGVFWW